MSNANKVNRSPVQQPCKPPRSGAGRPVGGDSERVRQDLLQAARNLFLANEFKAVSIRQIASAVGVNGAMVNYYFGSKQGLYLAMVDDLLQTLEAKLDVLNSGGAITIAEFSSQYCHMLAENPWWPNFMVREVLFSQGEIRKVLMEKISTLFVPKLLHSIAQEIAADRYRKDLDPTLTLLSIMGMTIFPFLARSLGEQALGLHMDDEFVDRLAAHNAKLFLSGVRNPESNTAGGTK